MNKSKVAHFLAHPVYGISVSCIALHKCASCGVLQKLLCFVLLSHYR